MIKLLFMRTRQKAGGIYNGSTVTATSDKGNSSSMPVIRMPSNTCHDPSVLFLMLLLKTSFGYQSFLAGMVYMYQRWRRVGFSYFHHPSLPNRTPHFSLITIGCHSSKFTLSAYHSTVLNVLGSCDLDAQDLADLEATCFFFRKPAEIFAPDHELSLVELAALDICDKRAIFKPMKTDETQELKQRCGGSWKLVMRFLWAGEACYGKRKITDNSRSRAQDCCHLERTVYSFGSNKSGQLGHGTTEREWNPRQIRSLQGFCIYNSSCAGFGRTMLICDAGKIYAFWKDLFSLTVLVCIFCWLWLVREAWHGSHTDERSPRKIEHFKTFNFYPVMVSAGCWACCSSWQGWQVYTLLDLGKRLFFRKIAVDKQGNITSNVQSPEMVSSPKLVTVKVVQVSTTGYGSENAHTFFLTESGKLYSGGAGHKGKLGIKLLPNQTERSNPEQVDVDLG
ncbi:hypothetical protein POM88_002839 [Heracleum sosnowskyi]|uniref:Uncharacterized protein n=1 Tax=Heracleum sosnowskyi TaxID=360622 RepID=A0AAD8NAY4_9APIA|nr:hypothetical protein POM88_002839 [Heracleum sosnowskyi]